VYSSSKRLVRLLMALLMVSAPELIARPGTEILKVSGFGNVTLYAPDSEPTQVVLFVSGDGGWNLGVVAMAERLRSLGALVAGIDIRSMLKSLEGGSDCAYPAGALEELSRTVQLHSKVRAYRRPILVGYSSGATLVYATLVAAPPETFAGAISKYRDTGAPGLAFLVGGAEGLAPEVLARADLKLSLGRMTLPHGLARIVLAEQLYRAATIIAGHPYHRA